MLTAAFGGDARADDVVGAFELGVRHEPLKRLKLGVGAQVRLDDFSRVESLLPEAQISYEPWKKHLTLGTGYRLIYQRDDQDYFEVAHRVHVQAAFSFQVARHAKLKYRLRLQDRLVRTEGEPTDHQPRLRNALELSGWAWSIATPFVSVEHYLALDRLSDDPTRRWRFMLGLQHDLGWAGLELYYRYDLRVNDNDPDRHMIGVGMQWEL